MIILCDGRKLRLSILMRLAVSHRTFSMDPEGDPILKLHRTLSVQLDLFYRLRHS